MHILRRLVSLATQTLCSHSPRIQSRRRNRRSEIAIGWHVERLDDRQLLSAANPLDEAATDLSVARQWNEALLDAIRVDTPRPTVHARNLFHVSIAMYDAWAAFDPDSPNYLTAETGPSTGNITEAQNEAISYAAYGVLSARFAASPGAPISLAKFDALMDQFGYDRSISLVGSNPLLTGDSPAAIGNRIALAVLQFGLTDGSNEANNYADTTGYTPVNPPLVVAESGTTMLDPNRWQPLTIGASTQTFLTPQWGNVTPFAMALSPGETVYHDPGAPPLLGGIGDAAFKEAVVRVIRLSSQLDATFPATIDISPAALGNNPLGADTGTGRDINPVTELPYDPNVVALGDYGRVLAEFWADGPHSETPPGHWNTIANSISDQLGDDKRIGGIGPVVDDLEWDVKLYLTLNGAVHDSAIAAWDCKPFYDYVRPLSMIRYMGGLGQSSDPGLVVNGQSTYHPDGLPLVAGLIEVITAESSAPGERHAHLADHVGEIAILAWGGHPVAPGTAAGVEWIRAVDWQTYQAATFVTPPFAAYVSGHSTFSRASAEVLTYFTGTEFFPGGLGSYTVGAEGNFGLGFEEGPSQPVSLTWATYYDAADEAGVSRIYGGIHVDVDDYAGRRMGSAIGMQAFDRAAELFGELVVRSTAGNGAETWLVIRNGTQIVITNQTTGEVVTGDLASISGLTIIGNHDEADHVVIDLGVGGSFHLANGVRVFGGVGDGDELVVRGTQSADNISLDGGVLRVGRLNASASGFETFRVEAGAGSDRIRAAGVYFAGQLVLDGGAGNDHLRGSRGDDLIFGGDGNDFVDGWFGNDVLVGADGHDVLLGGFGNDILIGGRGFDVLFGGPGEDILIGGFTTYDADEAALRSLRAEWTSPAPRSVRMSNLSNGGGLNGSAILAMNSTIFDNEPDLLFADVGEDWPFDDRPRGRK